MNTHERPTATVESLVAEVRALMIGKRQVTMSVYKQLDYLDIEKVELFGRVNVPKKDSDYDYDLIHVVGKSKIDGTLVSSSMSEPSNNREMPKWLRHKLFHADHKKWLSGPGMSWQHRDLVWFAGKCDRRECPKPLYRGDLQEPNYYDHRNARRVDQYEERKRMYQWLSEEYVWRRDTGQFCVGELADDIEAYALADVAADHVDARNALYRRVQSLPLIVLAGLR